MRTKLLAKVIKMKTTSNKEYLTSLITEEKYIKIADNTMLCCITLKNGFVLVGQSSCILAENFDEGIGKRVAYENAFNKIWELEGYLVKQHLYDTKIAKENTSKV